MGGLGKIAGKVGGQVVQQGLKQAGKQDAPKPAPAPQQQVHLPSVHNGTVQHHDGPKKGGCCISCTIM